MGTEMMELLTAGKINQKEAGKRLALSVRQIKRIVRRYRAPTNQQEARSTFKPAAY